MKRIYRIHGDNIVECERIANLILNEVHVKAGFNLTHLAG